MKVKIYVTLKEGVLDPQGKTAHHSLESLGYSGINEVRVGKYIELNFDPDSNCRDEKSIHEMCKRLLSNPVIEDYRIERED